MKKKKQKALECKGLVHATTVIIPESDTTIEDSSFYGHRSLESILIPQSITEIGAKAFFDCSSLCCVNIPDDVRKIGCGSFQNCTSLQSVRLPKGVTRIENDAFSYCSALNSINIENSVVTIGDWTFTGCKSLQSVAIPKSLKKIGSGAFCSCTSLQCVTFSREAEVQTIGDYCFANCSSLISISIPDCIDRIGKGTFRLCSSLESVIVPESVTQICCSAFGNCVNLKIIGVSVSTSITEGAFFGCEVLEKREKKSDRCHKNTEEWLQDRFDALPIHQACYNNKNLTTKSFGKLIRDNESSLAAVDSLGVTAMHLLCSNPYANVNIIEQLKSANPHLASCRDVNGMTPLMVFLALKRISYDDIAYGHDLGVERLMNIGFGNNELSIILSIDHEGLFISCLKKVDEKTGLCPLLSAATAPQCKLDMVYALAMNCPNLLLSQNNVL